jgi:hypothetical protein
MKNPKSRGEEIFKQIDDTLYKHWKPIDIEERVPRNEYEGYVGGVYRLLASGASRNEINEHLLKVEIEQIGVGISEELREKVIDELLKINISLNV